MTLTIRDIPDKVASALHARAETEGKTVHQVALEALEAFATPASVSPHPIDLSGIAGTWVDDPIFDQIRNDHEQIDPDLWK